MLTNLESVPLFKDIDEETLQQLANLFEQFSCPADTVIFAQGDYAIHVYLILEGSAEIQYKPYDTPPITITRLSKGDILGWSAVIGNPTYTSSAFCKEDCKALRMKGKDLHDFYLQQPENGRIILDLLAESVSARWTNAHNQIQSLLNSHVIAKGEAIAKKRKEHL